MVHINEILSLNKGLYLLLIKNVGFQVKFVQNSHKLWKFFELVGVMACEFIHEQSSMYHQYIITIKHFTLHVLY